MTQTRSKKSALRTKIPDANSIFGNLEDDSSESYGDGLRFFKSNTVKAQQQLERSPPPCSEEDELTADLLVPYTAVVDRQKEQSERRVLKTPGDLSTPKKQQTDSDELFSERILTVPAGKESKNSLSQRAGIVSPAAHSEAMSTLENTFIFQEGGDGRLGDFSLLSIAECDDSTQAAPTPVMLTEDVSADAFSAGFVVMSVDELAEVDRTSAREINSTKRQLPATKECSKSADVKEILEIPSSVSEVDECLELEQTCSVTVSKCSNNSKQPKCDPYSDDLPRAVSSTEPSTVTGEEGALGESDSMSQQANEEYCDDFESEDEESALVVKSPGTKTSIIHECKVGASSKRAAKYKKDRVRATTTPKRFNQTAERKASRSNSAASKAPENDKHVTCARRSVEVQTSWTGDILPTCQPTAPAQPQLWNVPQNFPSVIHYTAPEPWPIFDKRAIQSFSGYNPCLTALDNILRQQLHITREFMSSQHQLHRALSTTISRCFTTEYPTWTNTMQILTAERPG
ncbi:hypothetical protein CSKR_101130 [Clonorchis sinensis]|uniref:DUF4614 domain-containing protein n=1 Tax=Clonorchis sinensis TaxID=79923 RepID=A0A8T1M412_CLOSI|nr:hypothetical protein CSKR_101130 [Clonorchis sinensis]